MRIENAEDIRNQNSESSEKHCHSNTGFICGKNVDVPIFNRIFSKGNKKNENNKDK